jgi:hypothetical protein
LGDCARLPFKDRSFDFATISFVHTDIDDVLPLLHEVRRAVRIGAPVALIGSHPCFVGPFAERLEDGTRRIHAGYSDTGWVSSGPGIGAGIRSRVGVRHVPLAELLTAVAQNLDIEEVVETGPEDVPFLLGLRGRRRT